VKSSDARAMFGELQRVSKVSSSTPAADAWCRCGWLFAERGIEFDGEVQSLAFGHVTERARAIVLQLRQLHRTELHVHLAGFDLRQVQNVVDPTPASPCPRSELSLRTSLVWSAGFFSGVFRKTSFAKNQQIVQWRAQFRGSCSPGIRLLYFEVSASCSAFSSNCTLACSTSRFFVSTSVFCFREQLRLFLQLRVGLLATAVAAGFCSFLPPPAPAIVFNSSSVPHRGRDGVEHDGRSIPSEDRGMPGALR